MLVEKHLAIISLLCALLGITMLFVLNNAIEPTEIKVREINSEMRGQRVLVSGHVEWAMERENFVMFTLNDGEKIKAIKFGPLEEERILLRDREFVTIVGKIQLYKGELEIVAEEIRKW